MLDEISPNFYHAKIPDNGSVRVHTTISSCQKHLFGLINKCGDSTAGCGGCQCSLGEHGRAQRRRRSSSWWPRRSSFAGGAARS